LIRCGVYLSLYPKPIILEQFANLWHRKVIRAKGTGIKFSPIFVDKLADEMTEKWKLIELPGHAVANRM